MSGRELVILLLGLAIVAVVLRGLYVAINARRGQIKLAIDKNIPQNVDLEALEMAELPGGGARVVTRSLEEVNRQNSALDKAESKARELHLADEEQEAEIPVLMDAVEVAAQPAAGQEHSEEPMESELHDEESAYSDSVMLEAQEPEVETANAFEEEITQNYAEEFQEEAEDDLEEDFESSGEASHSLGEGWDEDESEKVEEIEERSQSEQRSAEYEDPDDVLFDYEDEEEEASTQPATDNLSSLAPDYDGGESDGNEEFSDSTAEAELDEELVEEEEEYQPFDADSSADEFSMTAGERIGGNPPTLGRADQSTLFDDTDEEREEEDSSEPVGKKGRSLFSLFGRKSNAEELDSEESVAVHQEDEANYDAQQNLEHERADEQPLEETSEYEDVQEESWLQDENTVDELDQKRNATVAEEVEQGSPQEEGLEHSEVLVLNVTAREGRVFAGDDLLHILITSGLKFGDMNIFHKRMAKDNQGAVIFSVANMLNPGTFDLNNMDDFTTLGISFFLALPTPINNLDAFEQMLDVAQTIRDTLDGDLKDDHRNGMTAQTIEHYRQRIRDFELRRLKAVAGRG